MIKESYVSDTDSDKDLIQIGRRDREAYLKKLGNSSCEVQASLKLLNRKFRTNMKHSMHKVIIFK